MPAATNGYPSGGPELPLAPALAADPSHEASPKSAGTASPKKADSPKKAAADADANAAVAAKENAPAPSANAVLEGEEVDKYGRTRAKQTEERRLNVKRKKEAKQREEDEKALLRNTEVGVAADDGEDDDENEAEDDEELEDAFDHVPTYAEDLWDLEASVQDVKVAIIGNVDSGKSTLVGVLTKGLLDDGRGKARSKVFNFAHEQTNGRTSSIAQEIMGFKEGGEQVLFDRPGAPSAQSRNNTWQHIVAQSRSLVTFIDLCGHEKYLKTTIFGLVGLCPDHAMIVVNANAGFQRMSREHLGIALALHIPFTIVVTKTDIAPANVFEENLNQLCRIMKSSAVKRTPIIVKTDEDLQEALDGHHADKACAIFCVSNVTGENLDKLKSFIRQLKSRLRDSGLFNPPTAPAEFHIDGVFNVTGVGVVAAGLMRGGVIKANQQLLLGPDKSGSFRPVLVKSIHYKRVVSEQVETGQAGSFALRSLVKKETLKKAHFRKGMVLVEPRMNPVATRTFKAEVVILHHATTIRRGYQALIHCGIIRQAASVRHMSCELLRTGDKAIVTFRFVYHGEFLGAGTSILFREGRTKGLGRVIEVVDESTLDAEDLELSPGGRRPKSETM